jgi:hypothetical protein
MRSAPISHTLERSMAERDLGRTFVSQDWARFRIVYKSR